MDLPPREPAHWGFVYWLLPPCAYGLLGAWAHQANGWMAVNLALLVIFWISAIVAHEFGHALAGHLLGFDVHWVVIGTGPRVSFRLGRVLVALGATPFSGAAFSTTRVRENLRRRLSMRSAAGPFMSLVGMAIGWLGMRGHVGHFFVEPAPFAVLFCANLFALRQTSVARTKEGVSTDIAHLRWFATATEEQLDAIYRGHAKENARWQK